MKSLQRMTRIVFIRVYAILLQLYPRGFRAGFREEIYEVCIKVLDRAVEQGSSRLIVVCTRELAGLAASIIRENWRALRSPKENAMTHKEDSNEVGGVGSWDVTKSSLPVVPSLLWIPGWALLTTAALPIAWFLRPLITFGFLLLLNAGARVGLLTDFDEGPLITLGFLIALSLSLGLYQWLLLRNYLPRAQLWIVFTVLGWLAGGLIWIAAVIVQESLDVYLGSGTAAVFILFGFIVGLVQWLYLRRIIKSAGWWILISVAASSSLLIVGRSITNLLEMMIILLPGSIMALGLWLLLRLSPHVARADDRKTRAIRKSLRQPPRLLWIVLAVVSLIPLFFVSIWLYAISQIALAKQEGVYPSPEEAVVSRLSQGWGGAEVVKLEEVRANINQHDGSQPHVWFGGARVYLDRIPLGGTRDNYSAGSYYVQVENGWVHIPEGAFPVFIGWVMELYGLEGVGEG
jgi:hypothetical protein